MLATVTSLLAQLNQNQEDARIEAKTASQFGRPIMETICAFANEPGAGGGHLLLGVAREQIDGGMEYRVVGVPDPDQLQTDIATACVSMFNIPIRPYLWVENIEGKVIVGVTIQEVQPQDKPVYLLAVGLPKGAYRRIGSSDQRCTEDDLLVLYRDHQHHSLDETMIIGADMTDIDLNAVDQYRAYRREISPAAEELRYSNEDLLYALGCADKHESRLTPTVAGILLFGTTIAIRRYFPMMRIDYIHVPGKEWIKDVEHRFTSVEFRGPLLLLIPRIHAAVVSDIPKQFSLPVGSTQRIDVPLIPDRVMREAIVNAVMHRTYRTHGAIQIIRYSNRLEFRNPGYSLVTDDHLGEPGSKTRNPKIAAVLHETRFAETKGSGIRVMREMMSTANLSLPAFESDRNRDHFVATFLFHHFLNAEDTTWLAQFREYNLSNEEAKALIFVREVGAITEVAYSHLNQVNRLQAKLDLGRLEVAGLLKKRSQGSQQFFEAAVDIAIETDQRQPIQLPLESDVQTLEKALVVADEALKELLPIELSTQIKDMGSRPSAKELRQTICLLCKWRPLTATQLALLLSRRRDYITTMHLRPMIEEGLLRYTVPNKPHSPKQAYVYGE